MTTIASTAGASSAWPDLGAQRTKMREKLFSKADSDGNGSVDASELQSMLARLSGNSAGGDSSSTNAADLLKKLDADGNGSLNSTELDAGMRVLTGPPASTMQFAQSRSGDAEVSATDASAVGAGGRAGDDLFAKIDGNGDGSIDAGELATFKEQMTQALDGNDPGAASTGSDDTSAAAEIVDRLDANGDGKLSESEFDAARPEGAHGLHGAHGGEGPPPAEAGAGAGSSGDSSSSAGDDPLDTNHDGVVSPEERLAGTVGSLLDQLAQASDANGDGKLEKSELGTLKDDLKSAFDGALQALQGGSSTLSFASTSGSTSGSGTGNDASSGSDSETALAQRFANLMLSQYAQFSNTSPAQPGASGLSLAA